MIKIISLKTLVIVTLFLFSGCASRKDGITLSLDSSKWVLLSAGNVQAGDSGAFITFDSTNKEVRGKAGCNGFGGNFSVSGSNIQFEGIMGTKMACPVLDVENAFLNSLHTADRYAISKNTLHLYKGEAVLATFQGSPKE